MELLKEIFIITSVVCWLLIINDLYKWAIKLLKKPTYEPYKPIGRITSITQDENGIRVEGKLNDDVSQEVLDGLSMRFFGDGMMDAAMWQKKKED